MQNFSLNGPGPARNRSQVDPRASIPLYQQPGIAETVNFDHIKRHYYITHDDINPSRIVPIGPAQDLRAPHGRGSL